MGGVIQRRKVDDLLKLLLAALAQISLSGGPAAEVADEALRRAEEMTR